MNRHTKKKRGVIPMNRPPLWRNAVWVSNFLASEVEAVGEMGPISLPETDRKKAPEN